MLLPISIDKEFHYYSNGNMIGDIVHVPFGNKLHVPSDNKLHVPSDNKSLYYGLVTEIDCIYDKDYELKEASHTEYRLDKDTMNFIKLVSYNTFSSQGEVLKMVLQDIKKVRNYKYEYENKEAILSEEQDKIFNQIKNSNGKILLEGVTGSGKTEIYFKLIDGDGQYLILVPEISLIYEMLERARIRLNTCVYAWHSKVSEGQRFFIWDKVIRGENIVIVATRSGLFLPFKNLKLIVIDEEHDYSYKQENGVIYHARDISYLRNVNILLASATPSIDAIVSVDKHFILGERYNRNLPKITFVKRDNKIINKKIIEKVIDNFNIGNQSMIFLNRKGIAHIMQCTCGIILKCRSCDSNMIYYSNETAVCHKCLKVIGLPLPCHKWNFKIYGIEKVVDEIRKLIPQARTLLVDGDTKSLHLILEDIKNHNVDIIVCTQILAKGHNFKNLTFVGVLDIATQRLIDPRSLERTFQIVTQVAGRVGRGIKEGEVYIESDEEIDLTRDFIEKEIEYRKKNNLIPFTKYISIIISSRVRKIPSIKMNIDPSKVYGPVEAPINRIKNLYRYRMLIEYNSTEIFNEIRKLKKKNIKIDSNPYYFY